MEYKARGSSMGGEVSYSAACGVVTCTELGP